MRKRPFFVELPNKRSKNHGIVKASSYAPAALANGDPGIMVILGNTLTTMTADEVHTITSQWLDALEEAEAKHARDTAA